MGPSRGRIHPEGRDAPFCVQVCEYEDTSLRSRSTDQARAGRATREVAGSRKRNGGEEAGGRLPFSPQVTVSRSSRGACEPRAVVLTFHFLFEHAPQRSLLPQAEVPTLYRTADELETVGHSKGDR